MGSTDLLTTPDDKDWLEIEPLIRGTEKYDILEIIDEGANACACVALHRHLDKKVFLKVHDACPERGDIFQEPRAIMRVTLDSSPDANFLVRVLDADRLSDDWVLFAMEYVEGGSLLKKTEEGGVSIMQAIEITRGILRGVSHMHANDLLHRDLKPANILLTADFVPKIADFGSVAIMGGQDFVTASRHSALYVPPEAWGDHSKYGVRSDIYQIGLVLYELINGALPCEGHIWLDSEAQKELKRCGKKFERLDDFEKSKMVTDSLARASRKGKIICRTPQKPYVNRTLMSIINKATAAKYDERYRLSSDMLLELNSLSFPDWHQDDKGVYFAENWKGYDWTVETIKRRGREAEFHVSKKKQCGAGFRKTGSFAKHLDAFEHVRKFNKNR